jgi:hypothetical protein
MTDMPKKTGELDRRLIDLSNNRDVRYWTKKWHVTKAQLDIAVRTVGPDALAVSRRLGKTQS